MSLVSTIGIWSVLLGRALERESWGRDLYFDIWREKRAGIFSYRQGFGHSYVHSLIFNNHDHKGGLRNE
jgi:hypothetical protein